jgi:hypothetical protein
MGKLIYRIMTRLRHLAAAILLASAFVTGSFAQFTSENNLGADCGCPAVSARANGGNISQFADGSGVLTSNVVLTCDKIWTLDKKIYVPSGLSITIKPGTVIKGILTTLPADAVALIISRGGKIFAAGEPTCPIVFTAASDNLDGSYPIASRGKWGGIVLLGKAPNNLIVGNTSNVAAEGSGVGFIEGFDNANAYNRYGMPYGQTDDNDNSGILRYVSIRHAGAILSTANELNGLSLGSVGRGTTLDHIEIIAADDDNIEFFGGRGDIKYAACYWGADDMFDWDLGWQGRVQFFFAIHTPDRVAVYSSDNGFEADSDDNTKGDAATGGGPVFMPAHPIIYNTTLIGAGSDSQAPDYSGPAAIRAKERTEGEIYNSVFANWLYGLDISDVRGALATPPGTTDAYQNWQNGTLIIKNNTFASISAPVSSNGLNISTKNASGDVRKGTYVAGIRRDPTAPEIAKFSADGNTVVPLMSTLGMAALGMTTPAIDQQSTITQKFDAVPSPELSSTIVPPADGFFKQVSYRGAFGGFEKNWLSGWSFGNSIPVTEGLKPCPTDIDFSGSTNTADLNAVLGAFGTSCQK